MHRDLNRRFSFVEPIMTREIDLTQGKKAIVSDEDYEWLSKIKWAANKQGNRWYAIRSGQPKAGERRNMHTTIMNPPLGMDTDHKDRNGLNNDRSNLLIVTRSQNMANRGPTARNTSGYKGVTWAKSKGKWQAQIKINYKHIMLGRFTDKLDAARAYDKAAFDAFGEHAWLNLK